MTKLSITCYGCDLYVDGDENDAERVNDLLKQTIEEVSGPKPDWYFKAKARATLGLEVR